MTIFYGGRDSLDMTDSYASRWRARHPWLYDALTGVLALICIAAFSGWMMVLS